jgi:hypothetical protein
MNTYTSYLYPRARKLVNAGEEEFEYSSAELSSTNTFCKAQKLARRWVTILDHLSAVGTLWLCRWVVRDHKPIVQFHKR